MDHFLKAVEEITVKDIASVAQKLLSSPLTMASYGDGNLNLSRENPLYLINQISVVNFPYSSIMFLQ